MHQIYVSIDSPFSCRYVLAGVVVKRTFHIRKEIYTLNACMLEAVSVVCGGLF